MSIIIGIDPGSCFTGYGIIACEGNQSRYIDSGTLRLSEFTTSERLQKIYIHLKEIIKKYQPHEAAIEQIFMHENPGSALKLGQARGAAIVALNMPISEYSARQVKQSVVGYGAADKKQVQHMVKRILNITMKLQSDAADALAVALCHAHSRHPAMLGIASRKSGVKCKPTRWRDYQPEKN